MFAHACKIGLAGIVSKRARGTMGLIDDGLARIMRCAPKGTDNQWRENPLR